MTSLLKSPSYDRASEFVFVSKVYCIFANLLHMKMKINIFFYYLNRILIHLEQTKQNLNVFFYTLNFVLEYSC